MKRRVLALAALLCAVYLSGALVVLGIDKFHYVLAGGKKFATLPNLGTQLGIGGSYLALSILHLIYFFGDRLFGSKLFGDRFSSPSRFLPVLKSASVFLLLAWLAFPLGDDIYLYLHAGLMNLSGANPFITRADAFTTVLSPFVDWGQTSTYGPVSQLLFTLSAAVIPISPILAIYVYKVFCLGFHLFNSYGIWKLLPESSRGRIAIAYLLHPLLLMEQVGSGHVDVLVSTSLVLFAGCLLKQRYSGAAIALWGGFLSKTIPLIWMPLVAILLIRQRRWAQLVKISLLSLGLIAVLSATVFPGWLAWKSLLNPGVAGHYQSSLAGFAKFGLDLLRIFMPASLTLAKEKPILSAFSQFTLVGFAAVYSWIALKAWRRNYYSSMKLMEDMSWVTLILLLFATPWLMPWYASVLLTFAALMPQKHLFSWVSLAFGLSSSAQYLLDGHGALKSAVMVGLPILVLIVGARELNDRSRDRLSIEPSPDQAIASAPLNSASPARSSPK